MVATVAADEPDTAAKIAQPMMLVWSSRPGSRFIHGASPWNMSCDSRVRNRISPIQMKSGSAVSVQLEAAPHTVTAIASPAGRGEKSCIPIQATPVSARPIQTPVPSRKKSAAISSATMAKSLTSRGILLGAGRLGRRGRLNPAPGDLEHQLVDERDQQYHGAHGHPELGNPERGRVVAGGDVVKGMGLPGKAHAVERDDGAQEYRDREAPELHRALAAATQRLDEQGDPDVLAALERVGKRHEAGAGHQVAGVGVRARDVEIELAPQDTDGDHHQH